MRAQTTKKRARPEAWRREPVITRSQAREILESEDQLGRYLGELFRLAFRRKVEEVTFSKFPDGLYATVIADVRTEMKHDLWAMGVANAIADATGRPLSVLVRSASEMAA